MNLKNWLDEERGRQKALAAHLGLTAGRVSQMAESGVPDRYKLKVRNFSHGSVTLESMVEDRVAKHSDTKEAA